MALGFEFLLVSHAAVRSHRPDRIALASGGREPLPYEGLTQLTDGVVSAFNRIGIGRSDVVASILPQGPEAAAAFVALSAGTVCAPLNPALTADELDRLLRDLAPAAVVIDAGLVTPARDVASAQRISVLELHPGARAGEFELDGGRPSPVARPGLAELDDDALVLHTSGTTSRPKLVPLTHGNLSASASAVATALALRSSDACLGVMPFFHIHGLVATLLASLSVGASVWCPARLEPDALVDLLERAPITWYSAVPTMHQAILSAARRRAHRVETQLRLIRSSSASLAPTVSEELEAVFGVPVIEAYGMTEAAHQMASNPLPPLRRKPGSVGLAAGPQVAVMDAGGRLLDADEIGEVVIQGPNVTAGYRDNDEANAAAFTHGWFRTGDQGRLDADGYLWLTGRLKELINRGGEKIAPREVDEALLAHPAVAQAVAFGAPHPTLGEEVAAAVVLRPGVTVSVSELRDFAAQRLARFKVPRRIEVVDVVPLGPTGKVQRVGLAERLGLTEQAPAVPRAAVHAVSAVERTIAALVRDTLEIDSPGLDVDFFRAGGDSLSAIALLSEISREFQVELPLEAIFDADATVRSLARAVEQSRGVSSASFTPPRRVDRDERLALAPAQERQWFIEQLHPRAPTYNHAQLLSLHGVLDEGALRRALVALVDRHEALRTAIVSDDHGPHQIVGPSVIELERAQLSDGDVLAFAQHLGRQPFDFDSGRMLRATVVAIGPDRFALVLASHFIAADGVSRELLVRDLADLYRAECEGKAPRLPAVDAQFVDVAAWQREQLDGDALRPSRDYWRAQFTPLPPITELPADRHRPPERTGAGERMVFDVAPAIADGLRAIAAEQRATLFMTLLTAFGSTLHRMSGQTDIVFGTPTGARLAPAIADTVGCLTNTLALRLDFQDDPSFVGMLDRVRSVCLGAFGHQAVPFDQVVNDVRPDRSLAHEPLFQVLFGMRPRPVHTGWLGDMAMTVTDVDLATAKYDLDLEIDDTDHVLRCELTVSTDIFDATTIQRMVRSFEVLLRAVTVDPHQRLSSLPLLGAHEQLHMLELSDGPSTPQSTDTLVELFERQVDRTPDAIAVEHDAVRMTYAALNDAADELADVLVRRGVQREVPVGLLLDRSVCAVVSVLAVLKAGGAYVPLDPSYPRDRLEFMLDDVRSPIVLSTAALAELLPPDASLVLVDDPSTWERGNEARDRSPAKPNDAAYIIYTSGSTGRPKGVVVEQRHAVHFVEWGIDAYAPEELERVLFSTSLNFDLSVFELFVPLTCGGTVVLVENALALVMDAPPNVTLVNTVPSVLNEVLRRRPLPMSVLTVNVCGEPLSSDLAAKVHAQPSRPRLVNLYGPTETTVYATAATIEPGATGPPPIGRPLPNVRALVLDEQLRPVPVGVRGELYLGGRGVARGYLRREELTTERFIADPFALQDGARLYRTGDLVRWRADGELDFLGRLDGQVKVRGHRVELGEIEGTLLAHAGVADAATIAPALAGDRRLVAYVVPSPAGVSMEELRQHAARTLPDYMVPAAITFVDELPHTPTGKIDRAALLDAYRPLEHRDGDSPRSSLEEAVAGVLANVLALTSVGAHDDFFDLGGHSLKAVELLTELERLFEVELSLRRLLEHPTPAAIATMLCDRDAPIVAPSFTYRIKEGSGDPVFCLLVWLRAVPQFQRLARHLSVDRPLYNVLAQWIAEDEPPVQRVEDMATLAVERIRHVQPRGPYTIAGYSMGGYVAVEVARQLRHDGEEVRPVVLIDAALGPPPRPRLERWLRSAARSPLPQTLRDARRVVARKLTRDASRGSVMDDLWTLDAANRRARALWTPQPFDGDAVLLRTSERREGRGGDTLGWDRVVQGTIRVEDVPGTHHTLLDEPMVAGVAAVLSRVLADER